MFLYQNTECKFGLYATEVAVELHETGLFTYAGSNIITFLPFKIGHPSGNINIISERTIVIYPNPVNNILYVNYKLHQLLHISIIMLIFTVSI